MGRDWKEANRRRLQKIVYALTEDKLKLLIAVHEGRGWKKSGEIKPYNRGVGCLMVCNKQ